MSFQRIEVERPCPGTALTAPDAVDLTHFTHLNSHGRRLIRGWLRRAVAREDGNQADSFEAFIFMWIAYNGWAACCTEEDADTLQNRLTASSEALRFRFQDLLERNARFAAGLTAFHSLWPIFNAREIRTDQLAESPDARPDKVDYYLANGISYEPRCFLTHLHRNQPIPMDWPHTLYATYRVRCNLFHGEKAAHLEADRTMVDAALQAMLCASPPHA